MTLINTTVAGNSASAGTTLDEGGGIFTQAGNVIILDSTIANNTAVAPSGSMAGVAVGGGIAWTGGSTIKINGSILAANTSDVVGSANATSDFAGIAADIDASASYDPHRRRNKHGTGRMASPTTSSAGPARLR